MPEQDKQTLCECTELSRLGSDPYMHGIVLQASFTHLGRSEGPEIVETGPGLCSRRDVAETVLSARNCSLEVDARRKVVLALIVDVQQKQDTGHCVQA